MQLHQQVVEIRNFVTQENKDIDIINLKTQIESALFKYYHSDYKFTLEDYYNITMYASWILGLLRKTYRLYIKNLGYKKEALWDVFIQEFIMFNHVSNQIDIWQYELNNNKEFNNIINKTSNPKMIKKILCGLNLKDLDLLLDY